MRLINYLEAWTKTIKNLIVFMFSYNNLILKISVANVHSRIFDLILTLLVTLKAFRLMYMLLLLKSIFLMQKIMFESQIFLNV